MKRRKQKKSLRDPALWDLDLEWDLVPDLVWRLDLVLVWHLVPDLQ